MAATGCGAAAAATTDWMTRGNLETYAMTSKSKQWYPTRIECKQGQGGPLLRLTTKPIVDGNKPFHKWNWVFGEAADLTSLVLKLKRSDRLDLKYRIVSKSTYKGADGISYGCAVAYR